MIADFAEENLNKKSIRKKLVDLRSILRNEPTNLEVRESLIRSLFFLGSFDEALEACRNLLSIAPNNPTAYWIMGNISNYRMQYDEGEKYLRKALELNPNFWQAYTDLGANLLCQHRVEEGNVEIHKSVDLNPHYWRAHYNLGVAYTMQFQYKKGRYDARLAWNEHKSVRTFLNLVMAYDAAYKKWSGWVAYGLALISIILPSIYTLPLFVLAEVRLSITALYLVQGNKKANGYILFALLIAMILSFVTRYS